MKRFLNFLKLYFAICCLLGTISMWVDTLRRRQMEKDDWYALAFTTFLFLTIAFLLLLWYLKTKRKLPQLPTDPYYSRFYLKFKPYLDQFSNKTFNGFGSNYLFYTNYDKAEKTIDATQWLIIGFFPILPVYRNKLIIHSVKERNFGLIQVEKSDIELVSKQLLDRKSNNYVYLFYYVFFYPMIVIPIVIYIANLTYFNEKFSGAFLWILFVGYLLWGIFIYALSELFNKRMFLYRSF